MSTPNPNPVTELELETKAVAPRVTNDQAEAFITSEHYFSAHQGALKATYDAAAVAGTDPSEASGQVPEQLRLMTMCVLVLANGFTVIGQSACADPKNFDPEIGQRLAREDAKKKIWAHLGFELRSKLHMIEQSQPASMPDMTTHIGTKVIHAMPMNRYDYNSLRGWELPIDENGEDLGYLVEYADGGQANVPGFKGYVSWSPKDVFDRSYGKPLTKG